MSKKIKQNEALMLLNRAYGEASQALILGKTPNFELFEHVKRLTQEAELMTDYTSCLKCGLLIEIDKGKYSRFYINQWNRCVGEGEKTQALNNHGNEVVLCEPCAKPFVEMAGKITEFLRKEE